MRIDAVIFDLDGTLVNFNLKYDVLRGEVLSKLGELVPLGQLRSRRMGIFDLLNLLRLNLSRDEREKSKYLKIREKIMSIVERYEMEAARDANIADGVKETLERLKRRFVKLGLFTINNHRSMVYILKKFKILGHFDVAVSRDGLPDVKPNPIHLLPVLKGLRADPNHTIVVGDSVRDVLSAKSLGILSCGVIKGVSSIQELVRAGADFVVWPIKKVVTLIDGLTNEEIITI